MKQGIHPEYVECTALPCGNTFQDLLDQARDHRRTLGNECHLLHTASRSRRHRWTRPALRRCSVAPRPPSSASVAKKAAKAAAAAEAAAKKAAEREAKAEKAKRAEKFARGCQEGRRGPAAEAEVAETAETEVAAEEVPL